MKRRVLKPKETWDQIGNPDLKSENEDPEIATRNLFYRKCLSIGNKCFPFFSFLSTGKIERRSRWRF